MKCLMRYQWVKLPRNRLPEGKGIMGAWAKLAARAAFREGIASYCGYSNPVSPGMWSGGMVGVRSILGAKNRQKALEALQKLSELGYIQYELNEKTKKLDYWITDWVVECSGEGCIDGTVYATNGYGFLCLPRDITQQLVEQQYIFEEADAWLDLWCHTVWQDPNNAFSFLAPAIQYGKYGAVLTLETLGQRWGWEKTKVWRFFKKHGDVFSLHRLPGAYGCLVFNKLYPTGAEVSVPSQGDIVRILDELRIWGVNTHRESSDRAQLNKLVTWYSRRLSVGAVQDAMEQEPECRVAHFDPIIRAYISLCWNCKSYRYDCRCMDRDTPAAFVSDQIRGPCVPVDLTRIAKEKFTYEQATSRECTVSAGKQSLDPFGRLYGTARQAGPCGR